MPALFWVTVSFLQIQNFYLEEKRLEEQLLMEITKTRKNQSLFRKFVSNLRHRRWIVQRTWEPETDISPDRRSVQGSFLKMLRQLDPFCFFHKTSAKGENLCFEFVFLKMIYQKAVDKSILKIAPLFLPFLDYRWQVLLRLSSGCHRETVRSKGGSVANRKIGQPTWNRLRCRCRGEENCRLRNHQVEFRVLMFVVKKSDSNERMAKLKKSLPSHCWPDEVFHVDAFPLSSHGQLKLEIFDWGGLAAI